MHYHDNWNLFKKKKKKKADPLFSDILGRSEKGKQTSFYNVNCNFGLYNINIFSTLCYVQLCLSKQATCK